MFECNAHGARSLRANQSDLLGLFRVGACRQTLRDMHKLFEAERDLR